MIDRHLRRGRAVTPVVVNRALVAHDDGLAAQAHVVEVLCPPGGRGRWRRRADARPGEARRRSLGVFEVFHLDGNGATGQIEIDREGRDRLDAPLVDDQDVIDPQAHAIIGCRREAVAAGVERQIAHPAHGEEVGRETSRWRAKAPVEVDVGRRAGQRRRAAQLRVGEILIEPVVSRRWWWRRRRVERDVGHHGHSHAARLVVLHDDGVVARAQEDVGGDGPHLAIVPGVDDQDIVDPDAHAVVGRGREAVGASGEVGRLCPLDGEVIGRDLWRW